MNIQSVQAFDAAVGQLSAIKGDVTNEQLTELTNLFSTQIWNTSDAEGTKANLERQIKELESLLDEIQKEIDNLYLEQKNGNEEMNRLLNDINEESYQASKEMDKNAKQQQDSVNAATDEAYRMYMKGDISKDEIPMKIAELLSKSNPSGASKLNAALASMDANGQKIYSLSDKIAKILDDVNELTAKFKTTETSIGLMKQLLAQVPEHKERTDIESTMAKPVYTPTQEALGDKLIDAFKVERTANVGDASEATALLNQALGKQVTTERKDQLDAMTPEEKAAAVEECDLSKYTALELMYMSGMDQYQAGKAIETVFNGAAVGYNENTGAIVVPKGHDGVEGIMNQLKSDYRTLWNGNVEDGNEDANGNIGGEDPFSWRQGDTTFSLTIDRDGDNAFDGPNEFVGAEQGWAEMTAADADNDGILTAEEMSAAGFSVMENDQSLKGGGTYGWNGVAESGIKSIDLNSFREITGIKACDLNGNQRVADFTVNLVDQDGDGIDDTTLGKQTNFANEEFSDMFYGHTYGEAFSFGLNPDDVSAALAEAAKPQNYTELEEFRNETLVETTEETLEAEKENLKAQEENLQNIGKTEKEGNAIVATEDNQKDNEVDENTTVATTGDDNNQDPYIEEEEEEEPTV